MKTNLVQLVIITGYSVSFFRGYRQRLGSVVQLKIVSTRPDVVENMFQSYTHVDQAAVTVLSEQELTFKHFTAKTTIK